MDRKKVPIGLVSSVSPSLCGKINEFLVRLGFTNINKCGWDDLVGANMDHFIQVFVIPVSQKNLLRRKIKPGFDIIRKMPVLGVIQDSDKNFDIDFLKYFNEFLYWPCTENEFEMRLEHLYNRFRVAPELTGDAKYLEDFIELNMVGWSPPFVQVLKQIKKIARCDAPVLIEGDTGTGKEMAARAIHYISRRRDFPFIPVNCGAIPDNLLENELFGHEKGAYTDAQCAQRGLLCQADKGTIFLDEVEAFSPKGQLVLLRFLEDLIFKPLGSEQSRQADVRIISASNRKLSSLVSQGVFRRDLFYRLDILSIELPPLSQRTGDIELLVEHFLNLYRMQYNQPNKYLHPDTLYWMEGYNWPGNVRELENMIHREFLLADGNGISMDPKTSKPEDRRKNLIDRRQNLYLAHSFNEAKKRIIDQFEKKYLTCLIRESNGNVTWAAKRAGKERRTLGKLLKKHNISKDGSISS